MIQWMAVVFLASTPVASVSDDAAQASQRKTAEVVTLAKTAPLVCPTIEADEQAIGALMAHAEITGRDIMDPNRFGTDDEAMARSFAQSVRANPKMCDTVFIELGDRLHLDRRKTSR